jgi:CheY-like chemotaxis protein
VDESQLSRVFANLVMNADHAMPEGGVIKVEAANEFIGADSRLPLQEGKHIRVSIRDQGVGISPEILPNIFDPYFTTKSKGAGLGLATAYSIVKGHDGVITVESGPGKGTAFHVYLPASEKQIPDERHSEEKTSTGGGRVLFMDDEIAIRELASDLLSALGYQVVVAADGEQAVERYRGGLESGRRFDAVILDLTIPGGMGGKETIRRLLALDPEVKAVVSSGYSNDPVMAEYKKFGFRAVIQKPYNAQRMSRVLAAMITGCEDEQADSSADPAMRSPRNDASC